MYGHEVPISWLDGMARYTIGVLLVVGSDNGNRMDSIVAKKSRQRQTWFSANKTQFGKYNRWGWSV